MMDRLTLTHPTAADIPLLAALDRAAFSDPWGEEGVHGQLESAVSFSLLLRDGGVAVGYLLATLIPPECEILRIGVLPTARRRGYGRRLLCALLSEAGARGAEMFFLDVRESNAAARALYTACGFTEIGRRRDFYRAPREDAILMERRGSAQCPHPSGAFSAWTLYGGE